MTDLGEVSTDIVLAVLAHNGVDVSRGEAGMVTLAKGAIIESHEMSDEVGRRLLRYFERKFGVPIYLFYNPPSVCLPTPH